jgi:hypothetical protein
MSGSGDTEALEYAEAIEYAEANEYTEAMQKNSLSRQ